MSIQWSKVVSEFSDWFVARVSSGSPEVEKRGAVDFSEETKQALGLVGFGERAAFLDLCSWEESEFNGGQLSVFVAVLGEEIVGYAICRVHSMITDAAGRLLGPNGKTLPKMPSKVQSLREVMAESDDSAPTLEAWCLEAIFVTTEFQRRGIGSGLVRATLESSGTCLEDMAYGEPISDAGAALFSSLGLSKEKMRRCEA